MISIDIFNKTIPAREKVRAEEAETTTQSLQCVINIALLINYYFS